VSVHGEPANTTRSPSVLRGSVVLIRSDVRATIVPSGPRNWVQRPGRGPDGGDSSGRSGERRGPLAKRSACWPMEALTVASVLCDCATYRAVLKAIRVSATIAL